MAPFSERSPIFMDTVVFDIETQNFFTDPGVGWNNFGALKISVVGVYSYAQNKYECFEESQMDLLAEYFRNAQRIVGFASNRYDTPVLNLYFKKLGASGAVDLWGKQRIDLLEEIERALGARISLSRLAAANLGITKEGHGSEAAGLYERGEIEALKTYCLKDVEITKQLYDLALGQGFLLVPVRGAEECAKVELASVLRGSPGQLF